MKIRFLLALVGLAIDFAVPTFAQQKVTGDPQITEQLKALSKKTDEAFNNGDAHCSALPDDHAEQSVASGSAVTD